MECIAIVTLGSPPRAERRGAFGLFCFFNHHLATGVGLWLWVDQTERERVM
jgi:hypothetical protein